MRQTSVLILMLLMFCRTDQVQLNPDRSQFFEGQSLSVICAAGASTRRNTTRETRTTCGIEWGDVDGSLCALKYLDRIDDGVYWCESGLGEAGSSANVIVTGGPVILQSPVSVMEGRDVILRCVTKTSSNLPAHFFKDGSALGTGPAGHMTIRQVSPGHEGSYRCEVGGVGQSPSSWMSVSGNPTVHPFKSAPPTALAPPPGSDDLQLLLRLFCHLVVFCPYFISTVLMVSLYRHRATGKQHPVSMAMAALPTQAERGLDEDDDIIRVTTEHQF
ncbi:Fc receptor-like protein 5 [Sphaeramia orbicularis]|uniref:Fc receptor-like protein 5 n=1 Tax=Sphaeramia orbicularis TaxID=375764 RepID=UPI00117F6DDE|nr:Fc receptor-like protein 5 [Sphaeramia orbicularis]